MKRKQIMLANRERMTTFVAIIVIAVICWSTPFTEGQAKDLVESRQIGNAFTALHSIRNDLQNVDEKYLQDKNNKISNVSVNTIYTGVLQLNVSWEKPESPIWTSYDFRIVPKSTHSPCSSQTQYETYDKHKDLTNLLLPPYPPKNTFEIYPECVYEVSVIPKPSINKNEMHTVVYEVPECVGKICSCRRKKPQAHDLKVTSNMVYINILWEYNNSLTHVNNITDVSFAYRSTIVSGSSRHLVPFLKLPMRPHIPTNSAAYQHNGSFKSGIDYELRAYFVNNYNCRNFISTTFQIPVESKPVADYQNYVLSRWFDITLFVALIAVLLLVAMFFFKRNPLVIKALLRSPLTSNRCKVESGSYQGITKQKHDFCMQESCIYVEEEIYVGNADQYEFPRAGITLIKSIGSGAFGQVFLAKALSIDKRSCTNVAVKKLRESAPNEEVGDFLAEIDILKRVGKHTNIVSLLGCCTLKEPYLMVMEYVPCGDLKRHLLELRDQWNVQSSSPDTSYVLPNGVRKYRMSSETTELTTISSNGMPTPAEELFANTKSECKLDHNELQKFAMEIATGMAYLEKLSITHRDLAARNILIDEYRTLKISDFGLSRTGPYVNSKVKKLPLRWMAIESIQSSFFNNKSDVWSFAVVLWEIGTLGAFPYEKISDRVVFYSLLKGERLKKPEICTDELYNLMVRCWSKDPRNRPSFEELVQVLDCSMKRAYVDFTQLNPSYVFPSVEAAWEYEMQLLRHT